jgi:hypothetical protein
VWLALDATRLLEAKVFSGLALAVLVRELAVIGLSRERPRSSEGGASCRQLPPRLKQPTASTIGFVGMSFSAVTERIPLKAKASSTPLAIDALGS